jgi:predicted dehydrogenase
MDASYLSVTLHPRAPKEIAYFIRCVDRNEPPRIIEPEDGIEAVRIAQAVSESSERHQPVDLTVG